MIGDEIKLPDDKAANIVVPYDERETGHKQETANLFWGVSDSGTTVIRRMLLVASISWVSMRKCKKTPLIRLLVGDTARQTILHHCAGG